jgi:hypothetical protein
MKHPAQFPDDQFQIDQTQLQIGYRTERDRVASCWVADCLGIAW